MSVYAVRIVLIFVVLFNYGNTERTRDKMYEELNGNFACFRRLNATHQTGCSSSRRGTTGVVHYVEQLEDIHFILENGTLPPYVPVIPISLLKPDIIYLLKNSDKVAGLIIYKSNDTINRFSHEDTCPNIDSNLEATCTNKWNKFGTGLLREEIPYPIFYVDNNNEIDTIKDCFDKFNNFSFESHNVRALCSVELSSFMFATTDTPTCLRRSQVKVNFNPTKFCDPLGDENIWASLFPIANVSNATISNNMKHIMVVAHIDSTSMFHEKVPGAINPVTSLVTLLTTAHLLKKMLPKYMNYEKNVLFVIFNGESYDYIGSQRIVYDMEHNEFPTTDRSIPPINLTDISMIIELNQLSQTKDLFAYILEEQEIRNFITNLKKQATNFVINENNSILPPSSLQSFMQTTKPLPAIVLTDHGTTYKNNYYNSLFDDGNNINFIYYPLNETEKIPKDSIQYHIANVSNMLAGALYQEVRGNKEYAGSATADVVIVNELLNCYINNANCTIHRVIQKRKFIEEPLPFYVSVTVSPNYITHVVGLALAWLTGEIISNSYCNYTLQSPMYKYYNMSVSMQDLNKTVCYRTIMNFTDAISPAFIIKDYDWSSGKYSSWSESSWTEFSLRLYLKPSVAHENMTIAIGSLVLVLSFALVYFIKSRSHILFAPVVDMAPTRC